MNSALPETGREELRASRRESRSLYWLVGVFSLFANLLMLTGPLYMLQVYDRVLGSGSVETLVALSILVAFLYGVMGLIDYARARIMGRVAARFQDRLDRRVFDAVIRKSAIIPNENTATGLRDLEAVQRLMSSPVLMAFFDVPWTPIFLIGIWIFHPWLGILALSGGAVLIIITLVNQLVTRKHVENSNRSTVIAESISNQLRIEAEMLQAMGMRKAAFVRWQSVREQALQNQMHAADLGGTFTSMTKIFRLFLQSAMLGLGAYLVLRGEMTGGAMIAGSILLGRALAPIEQIVGQWALVQRAQKGWASLAQLLADVPPEERRVELPIPKARLEVQGITVAPPGARQATLKTVSFTVEPGEAVGVIGASGSGKSTLAKALTGAWRPAAGRIRLDGASLEQYDPSSLGQYIGYLPQRVQLFDGTIAENIARLSPQPDEAAVVEAAKQADAHQMILNLPDGYDTTVTAGGGSLSGGQMQRIGLARAIYGDPIILILDEPNSNLDNEGSEAVNAAIKRFKAAGKSVLIIAHRPSAIKECEMLVMLANGVVRAFGPKQQVLSELVKNHAAITPTSPGGVS